MHYEFLIEYKNDRIEYKNDNIYWDWREISANPNITMDDITSNLDKFLVLDPNAV
jgi:hypothetical protein